jgi:hypothetical protein
MHNVAAHMILDTYWELSPQAQFCAILLLLLLGPSIIAVGLSSTSCKRCMKTTSVNDKFDMYVECIKEYVSSLTITVNF